MKITKESVAAALSHLAEQVASGAAQDPSTESNAVGWTLALAAGEVFPGDGPMVLQPSADLTELLQFVAGHLERLEALVPNGAGRKVDFETFRLMVNTRPALVQWYESYPAGTKDVEELRDWVETLFTVIGPLFTDPAECGHDSFTGNRCDTCATEVVEDETKEWICGGCGELTSAAHWADGPDGRMVHVAPGDPLPEPPSAEVTASQNGDNSTVPDEPAEVCPKCLGCGQIANDDDGTPWSAWAELPPGSDMAVRMGLVRPLPCPGCSGGADNV